MSKKYLSMEKVKTYGDFKKTKEYYENDISFCLNGSGPFEPMYFQDELDDLPIIGFSKGKNEMMVDLVCKEEEFEERMGFKNLG